MDPGEAAALDCIQIALVASAKAVALDGPGAEAAAVARAYREALAQIAAAAQAVEATADAAAAAGEVARLASVAEAYEQRALALERQGAAAASPLAVATRRELNKAARRPAPFLDLFGPPATTGAPAGGARADSPKALRSELEPPPSAQVPHACWRLRAVRRSLNGGWLSARLFAPPGLYAQRGARVVGLSLKTECYAAAGLLLHAFCEATRHRPPSPASDAPAALAESLGLLEALNRELATLHERLYRACPYLVAAKPVAVEKPSPVKPSPAKPDEPPPAVSGAKLGPAGSVAGWSSWGAAVAGRAAGALRVSASSLAAATSEAAAAASQQALSAYARAKHAAVAERLSDEAAAKLTAAIDAVCVNAQIFDLW